jgi:hypothetical protein
MAGWLKKPLGGLASVEPTNLPTQPGSEELLPFTAFVWHADETVVSGID